VTEAITAVMPTRTKAPVLPFFDRNGREMSASVWNWEDDILDGFDDLLQYVDVCDPGLTSPVSARVDYRYRRC